MSLVIMGLVLVLMGIVVWGAGLLAPGGIVHNPLHMVAGMVLLVIGGNVSRLSMNGNSKKGTVRTQQ